MSLRNHRTGLLALLLVAGTMSAGDSLGGAGPLTSGRSESPVSRSQPWIVSEPTLLESPYWVPEVAEPRAIATGGPEAALFWIDDATRLPHLSWIAADGSVRQVGLLGSEAFFSDSAFASWTGSEYLLVWRSGRQVWIANAHPSLGITMPGTRFGPDDARPIAVDRGWVLNVWSTGRLLSIHDSKGAMIRQTDTNLPAGSYLAGASGKGDGFVLFAMESGCFDHCQLWVRKFGLHGSSDWRLAPQHSGPNSRFAAVRDTWLAVARNGAASLGRLDGTPIGSFLLPTFDSLQDVRSTGDRYLVSAIRTNGIVLFEIMLDGTVREIEVAPPAAETRRSLLATRTDDGYVLAWREGSILEAALHREGMPLRRSTAAWTIPVPDRLTVARNDAVVAAAFVQKEGATPMLRLISFPLDGSGPIRGAIRIAVSTSPGRPSIVPYERGFALAWVAESSLVIERIDRNGTPTGERTTIATGNVLDVRLATTRRGVNAFWTEQRVTSGRHIMSQMLDEHLRPFGSAVNITPPSGDTFLQDVVAAGTTTYVHWREIVQFWPCNILCPPGYYSRVSILTDQLDRRVGDVHLDPSIAGTGAQAGAVGEDLLLVLHGHRVRALRISPNGSLDFGALYAPPGERYMSRFRIVPLSTRESLLFISERGRRDDISNVRIMRIGEGPLPDAPAESIPMLFEMSANAPLDAAAQTDHSAWVIHGLKPEWLVNPQLFLRHMAYESRVRGARR